MSLAALCPSPSRSARASTVCILFLSPASSTRGPCAQVDHDAMRKSTIKKLERTHSHPPAGVPWKDMCRR